VITIVKQQSGYIFTFTVCGTTIASKQYGCRRSAVKGLCSVAANIDNTTFDRAVGASTFLVLSANGRAVLQYTCLESYGDMRKKFFAIQDLLRSNKITYRYNGLKYEVTRNS